jgi:hypothetical protein
MLTRIASSRTVCEPCSISVRPGTNEVRAGDVGWSTWGDINRVVDPGSLENCGWPCYESEPRQLGYDGANLNVCENLYGQARAVTSPHFAPHHTAQYHAC